MSAGVLILLVSCAPVRVESLWADEAFVIDGHDADWRNNTVHLATANTAVGVANDRDALYLVITPWDRSTQALIMTTGMVLWVEPDGDHEEGIGIEFSVRDRAAGFALLSAEGRTEATAAIQRFVAEQGAVIIYRPASGDTLVYSPQEAHAAGCDIVAGEMDGRLCCEFRLPFAETGRMGLPVTTVPGTTLKLTFMTRDLMEGRESYPEQEANRPAPFEESDDLFISQRSEETPDMEVLAPAMLQHYTLSLEIPLATGPAGSGR